MAKVKIVRPITDHTTVLQGKKKDLLNYLSDVAHSLGPLVSRGMLQEGNSVLLQFPSTIEDLTTCCRGSMQWYGDELPSLKAERRRLAKKLNKKEKFVEVTLTLGDAASGR